MERHLEKGFWLHTKLAEGTTDEQIAAHFEACGIHLDLENISSRDYPSHTSAIIRIEEDTLKWLINYCLEAKPMEASGEIMRCNWYRGYVKN